MPLKFNIFFLGILMLFAVSCRQEEKKAGKKSQDSPVLTSVEAKRFNLLLTDLEELKADRCMKNASLGYFIIDITRENKKTVIAECEQTRPMMPASTLKLFVTAPALEIFGPPIIPEVTVTNEHSVNWRSSKLLRRIGGKIYNHNTKDAGVQAILEFWKAKGLDTRGMYLDDGNGLSRNNAISPKQLVDALYIMTNSKYFLPFYESLPIAGLTGTLHKALRGTVAEGRVRAKTGTIAGVKSFAGYVKSMSGRELIFSIIVNDYSCRTKLIKKKLEAILLRMAEV
ncbi:MAG: D-alanyl-D-alanine carboxypeptidase/D-alanyl-D-alanine-endopeptidase [Bacteroidetes bacterium]|nr:D-alanyl-D-alanine carboxypeptidase/D-alanyl-D-alanine-endopeptidase [Bacteroidota bacterium]